MTQSRLATENVLSGQFQSANTQFNASTVNAQNVYFQHTSSEAPPPTIVIPYPRNRDFIEQDVLGQICEELKQPSARVALVGLGGIGKSQVAIECAYRRRLDDPQCWVFWVHASNPSRFYESYKTIAERARIPGWRNKRADHLQLVYQWLSQDFSGRWLMIVDNADDEHVLFNHLQAAKSSAHEHRPLSESLPTVNGSILLTTRNREVAHRMVNYVSCIFNLEPMASEKAVRLFKKKLRQSQTGVHSDMELLVQKLDYMPLAISQAAAFIDQRDLSMSVVKYLAELDKGDQDRTRLLEIAVRDPWRDRESSNSILRTLHISFQYIQEHYPSAARLMSLMSMFDCEGIPTELLQGYYFDNGDTEADMYEDLQTLRSFDLISIGVDTKMFKIHRLIQFSIQAWLQIHDELDKWIGCHIFVLSALVASLGIEDWSIFRRTFPHLLVMIDREPVDWPTSFHQACVLYRAAACATSQGQMILAERMLKRANDIFGAMLGPYHRETLGSLLGLVCIYSALGRHPEADDLCMIALRRLKSDERIPTPEDLQSLSFRISTLRSAGKLAECRELCDLLIAEGKTFYGVDSLQVLSLMSEQSQTYYSLGLFRQSASLGTIVLEKRKRLCGENHPETLSSIIFLSKALYEERQCEESFELLQKAIKVGGRLSGGFDETSLSATCELSRLCAREGRLKEAITLQTKVVVMQEASLGAEHPKTLYSWLWLVNCYVNLQQYERANEFATGIMNKLLEASTDREVLLITAFQRVVAIARWKLGRYAEVSDILAACRENCTELGIPCDLDLDGSKIKFFGQEARTAAEDVL